MICVYLNNEKRSGKCLNIDKCMYMFLSVIHKKEVLYKQNISCTTHAELKMTESAGGRN